MPADRRFADFYEGALPFQMSSIPDGGMCLSVFLVLWKKNPRNVLLGKVNKDYDWISIGALDKESATEVSERWMLPSSHLLLYESPHQASRRVLSEQLGIRDVSLEGPKVFSEVYDAPRYEIKNHWDIEFVFSGEIKEEVGPHHPSWSELKFLDVSKLSDSDFARNHQDILSEVGVR